MKRNLSVIILSLALLANLFIPMQAAGSGTGQAANPFEQQDLARQKAADTSTLVYTDAADCSVSQKDGGVKDSYIIQFRRKATLSSIYGCVSNYAYSLLADSSERLFSIQTDDINNFREKYADIIQWIHPNSVMTVADTDEISADDSDFSQQWALNDLKLPQAWKTSKGSRNVKVAVLDTGFDRDAPDFNVSSSGEGSYISSGCDLSSLFTLWGSSGSSDEYPAVKTDQCGHGTSVISVIASQTNNSSGIAGACWDVTIVPYKIGDRKGDIYENAAIKAIYMAADAGCDVINMSFGIYNYYDSAMQTAIDYAAGKGCLLVAAAGNEGDEEEAGQYSYPASYDNVVSVASVNNKNSYSDFSQYNSKVDVSAPGEDILVNWFYNTSSGSAGSIRTENGTSYASPYVAAIAALARSLDSSITSAEFLEMIRQTSTDLGTPSWDKHYGWGLIDAEKIVALATEDGSRPAVASLLLNKTSLALKGNATAALTAAVAPSGSDSAVTWISSNAKVARVNESGTVKGIVQGYAVITAISAGGKSTASCRVTVDTTAPVIKKVVYSTKSITNRPVEVTVYLSGGTVSKISHRFASNGSYRFKATDAVGNTVTKTVKVSNIDKNPPKIKASVRYNKKTHSKVKVTCTDAHLSSKKATRNGKKISWNSGVFKVKGKYVITAKDKAGNKSVYKFTIC